jgi:hypothetical protein
MKAKVKNSGEIVHVFTLPSEGKIKLSDGHAIYAWDELEMCPNSPKAKTEPTTRKVVQLQQNVNVTGKIS